MADITLSNAVRNNLLSLQKTADLLGKTQNRLSTGLKVNSALDDPTAFFTASSLNSRAGDLNRLLDSVSNAVQTVRAADNGLSAITKLVESAQATARQALQKPLASPASVAGTGASVVADSAATATGNTTTADVAATAVSGNLADDTAVDNLTGTISITGPNGTYVIDFDGATGTSGTAADSLATLDAEATAASTATGLTVDFNVAGGGPFSITAADNTTSFSYTTVGGNLGGAGATAFVAAATVTVDPTNATVAGFDTTLSISIGGATATTVDLSTIDNNVELSNALTAVSGGTISVGATGIISVAATATDEDIVISASGGDAAGDLDDLFSAGGVATSITFEPSNADIAALDGESISFTVGAGAAQTITFGTDDSSNEVSNFGELEARLAAIQSAVGGNSTFSVDSSGNITATAGNSTDSIVTAGSSLATLNEFGIGAFDGTTDPTQNTDRAALESQYNNLRTQIDALAGDASFNGINLLNGDSLQVIFNENNTSSLTISGVTFNSTGLGITEVATDDFQNNTTINAKLSELDTAIGTLRQQGSTFGSNLSVVEVRQDFTKSLINTLETGAANLTLADTNEEGANLLALQTRQQLSSVALSLASQADQNVLRLF